jgi:hypothetical protein
LNKPHRDCIAIEQFNDDAGEAPSIGAIQTLLKNNSAVSRWSMLLTEWPINLVARSAKLANSQRSNGQQIVELDDAAPPSEADKFVWGFEEEDYEQATAETLLRYLAFQEKELGKIGTEPPSENREYRTKRLKDQIKQTTEWYNRKNTSTF